MKNIKVLYIGKRFDGVHFFHHFKTESGKDLAFKRVRYCYIGSYYEAHQKNDGIFISRSPKQIGDERHKNAEKWQVIEWADATAYRQKIAKDRLAKGTELLSEIPRIKKYVQGLSYSEKIKFSTWLIDQLEKE